MKYSEKQNKDVRYYGLDTRLHAVRVVALNRYKSEDLIVLKKYTESRANQAVAGLLFGTSYAFNWIVGLLLGAFGALTDTLNVATVVITGGVWFFLNMSKLPTVSKIKRTNRGELTEDDMRSAMTTLLNKAWLGAVLNAAGWLGFYLAATFTIAMFGIVDVQNWLVSWCALTVVFVVRACWYPNIITAVKEIKGLYNSPFRNHSSVDI